MDKPHNVLTEQELGRLRLMGILLCAAAIATIIVEVIEAISGFNVWGQILLRCWPLLGLVVAWVFLDIWRRLRAHFYPPPVGYKHPNSGRFCHICGADAHKGERCDAGLHS